MSLLFDDARSPTPPRRSTSGLWLSVGVHVLVAGVLIVVPMRGGGTPPAPRTPSMRVFLPAIELPSAPVARPRLVAPPPPPKPIARADATPPPPVAPAVPKPVEPDPVPPAPVAAAIERPVEKPVEKAAVQRPPETGLFERTSSARTTQADAVVTTGAFGGAPPARNAATAVAAVAAGGFGSAAARGASHTTGTVQTAGFDQRPSARPQAAVAAKPIDRPVEIVFKPTPEYTDDARSARIEGTVSLELEFTATGDVRVLRVVRGLGHGLDEAAERAALRIRFKPAQSDGAAVDSRATVHITFRLS